MGNMFDYIKDQLSYLIKLVGVNQLSKKLNVDCSTVVKWYQMPWIMSVADYVVLDQNYKSMIGDKNE